MLIAVTGGIGSGKTAVLEIINSFGGNILSADEINSELLTKDFYIERICKLFPGVVNDNVVDRIALGKKVFYDPNAMQKLNDLAHPYIIAQLMEKAKAIPGRIFVEVPLLIESNMQDKFEKIWLVKASKELRMKRILMRDLVSEDYAKRIMAMQATDKIREMYATDIIINNGDSDELYSQVKTLYDSLING